MTTLRKLMISMVIVGVTTTVAAGGTFASFSASVTNDGSLFQTGSLVLSSQTEASTATMCLSTGGGTNTDSNANATGCDAAFSPSAQSPGGEPVSSGVTLENVGNVDGDGLTLTASACTPGDVPDAQTIFHGTGDPCDDIEVYVQEYDTQANMLAGGSAGRTACVYGGGTAAVCDFAAAKTLASLASTTIPSTTLGTLGASDGVTGSGPDARFFRFFLRLQDTADNTVQGRQAAIDLSWTLTA